MNDDQIKYMVSRFLTWRLPENFNPDGGISFKRTFNEHTSHPMKHEPVGTNLFDYTQAEQMIRYLIDGLESGAAQEVSPPSPERSAYVHNSGVIGGISDRVDLTRDSSLDNTTTRIPCGSESSETGRIMLSGVQDHADAAQIVGELRFEIIKYNMVCWKVYLGNSYLGAHNTEQQAANFVKNLEINIRKFMDATVKSATSEKPMEATYYVRHLGDSYSEANPQPTIYAGDTRELKAALSKKEK